MSHPSDNSFIVTLQFITIHFVQFHSSYLSLSSGHLSYYKTQANVSWDSYWKYFPHRHKQWKANAEVRRGRKTHLSLKVNSTHLWLVFRLYFLLLFFFFHRRLHPPLHLHLHLRDVMKNLHPSWCSAALDCRQRGGCTTSFCVTRSSQVVLKLCSSSASLQQEKHQIISRTVGISCCCCFHLPFHMFTCYLNLLGDFSCSNSHCLLNQFIPLI